MENPKISKLKLEVYTADFKNKKINLLNAVVLTLEKMTSDKTKN